MGLRVRSSSSAVSAAGNSAACLSATCLATGGCSHGNAVVSACMLSMVFDGCTAGVGDIIFYILIFCYDNTYGIEFKCN